jgi:hypothetical protein
LLPDSLPELVVILFRPIAEPDDIDQDLLVEDLIQHPVVPNANRPSK